MQVLRSPLSQRQKSSVRTIAAMTQRVRGRRSEKDKQQDGNTTLPCLCVRLCWNCLSTDVFLGVHTGGAVSTINDEPRTQEVKAGEGRKEERERENEEGRQPNVKERSKEGSSRAPAFPRSFSCAYAGRVNSRTWRPSFFPHVAMPLPF